MDNAKAVFAALSDFGVPLESMTVADFADRSKFFRMGREPVMVDILPELEGVDFDRVWDNRVESLIDAETGQRAFFISRDDLIAAKLAAGRPQDIADVAAIRNAGAGLPRSKKENGGTEPGPN